MVEIPDIVRLEEEFHNFLHEAKNFVRDFLKAFNILYGATFAEASNYFRPATPKNGKQSLMMDDFVREELPENLDRAVCLQPNKLRGEAVRG